MKILLTAATSFELAPSIQHLESQFQKKSFSVFEKDNHEIHILITGVGPIFTAHGLAKFFNIHQIDLAIHVGIAGAYDQGYPLGMVVQVIEEQFGDLGVENQDQSFSDIFDLRLHSPDFYPFKAGRLLVPEDQTYHTNLPQAKGLTVSQIPGTRDSINRLKKKYDADIESMEGASFFYACLTENIDFISLRAISNHVVPRNREEWNIPLAIDSVNKEVIRLISKFSS